MRLRISRKFSFVGLCVLSCCLFNTATSKAQERTIKGKVVEATNQPLPGVTVENTTTKKTTQTDLSGNFTMVANTNDVLNISYIGFKPQTIKVGNTTNNLNIILSADTKSLEEVVVIGYGTQKRANVSGAVSSFKADQLEERPVGRVDQAMVGQMAGVTVKQTTGLPGKGLSIQVRGTGTISSGSEPLYVIDGFPLATAAPNGSGNYATGNPLDNINPNDIESIQVLKDAASAAIYGSRAANGVVLITTKSGKQGKAKINVNTYVGYNEAQRHVDMLSATEWIDRATEMINYNWVTSAPGRTASQTNEQRRVILGLQPGQINTTLMYDDRWYQPGMPGLVAIDWQNEGFRKGLTQNYQLSASGGTEAVKYYISGNYAGQEGMLIGLNYKAYSARANVEVKPNKDLTVGLNFAPTYSVGSDPGVEGKDNILHQLTSLTPVQEQASGIYTNAYGFDKYAWSSSPNSPIAKLESTLSRNATMRNITSIYAQYQILKGLNFKTTINFDNTDFEGKVYRPYTITGSLAARQTDLTKNTSGSFSSYRKQTLVNENTLNYNTTFDKDHNLSLLAGYSYNQDKLENASLSSTGGFSSSVITTLNAANSLTGNTTENKNVLLSYFGRAQYDYKGKYLFSASIRRDGSSRFGANTQWGIFPAASLAWRVTEENFMENIKKTLSDLKLRLSYGESGNYNIGDYSSIPVLATYNYSLNGVSVVGQAPSTVVNPDLKWEKSRTINFGFDFGLIKNRISGSFDIYKRKSSDLLLNVSIPQTTGFNTLLTNAGEVQNKGWEFEVTSRNLTGDFSWNTSLNIAHNSNKVTSLPNGQTEIIVPSSFDIPHSVIRVGEPLFSINVVKQIGILTAEDIANGAARYGNQTEGDPKYFDAKKDGVIDADDRVIVGHPNPDYTYGITNEFKYKKFDLSVLVQGQTGGSLYSLFGRSVNRTGTGITDNVLGTWANRWRSPSDPGDGEVGKTTGNFGRIKNTDWLYSSDYIRVRNITLGYNLGSALKVKQINNARIYISAENFFGHDKYTGGFNPEASNTNVSGSSAYPETGDYGGLPLAKSLIFGLNITF
ncbi:SusC/RagA family TonB-linked outer membrane protein [Pelobium manganitolerans]|uniref:SusC/RagA family TonB-linked outer membrane protein n=1 Tax=Pelobium manganitolerans TaxID=1842495 RepID=A0A419S289_9SPHI|nr:TonB-dependent receptor [Pelobium manganitolerans]RKD12846.1 SusC/RagA family TonB-linked outer membrane protein [Pelobium manganitolerans]